MKIGSMIWEAGLKESEPVSLSTLLLINGLESDPCFSERKKTNREFLVVVSIRISNQDIIY